MISSRSSCWQEGVKFGRLMRHDGRPIIRRSFRDGVAILARRHGDLADLEDSGRRR
jgi:hypothetical protein